MGHLARMHTLPFYRQPTLDYQPLFGKGARAPPPEGKERRPERNVDRTRETCGNRVYPLSELPLQYTVTFMYYFTYIMSAFVLCSFFRRLEDPAEEVRGHAVISLVCT